MSSTAVIAALSAYILLLSCLSQKVLLHSYVAVTWDGQMPLILMYDSVSFLHIIPLRPSIKIQILLSELLTFSYSISWENYFVKRSRQFPYGDHFIHAHNLLS